MDKTTAQKIDERFKELSIRQDKIGLAKISQKLISVFELGKLWLSLKPGEGIWLDSSGSLHKGRREHVRLEKMFKLQEAFRTEEKSDILAVHSDPKTALTIFPFTGGFNRNSKNWDTRSRLANGKSGRAAKISAPPLPADDI